MMAQAAVIEIPKGVLIILNHLYEIERKLTLHGDAGNVRRNLERIKEELQTTFKLSYEDPMGQAVKDTRIDLEFSVSGPSTSNLVVTEVIKPIVRVGNSEISKVVQKGVVVVQGSDEEIKR
jgi:hypothetical protein